MAVTVIFRPIKLGIKGNPEPWRLIGAHDLEVLCWVTRRFSHSATCKDVKHTSAHSESSTASEWRVINTFPDT